MGWKEFNLIKQSTLNQVIQQKEIQIVSAQIEYRKLIYGNDFILSLIIL
jgi:hypothetical protein